MVCTAPQVTEFEYDLVLQPDINTRGHTQWFFFATANTRAGVRYRFNIINLLKEDSLYNMGMLPLMHSEQQIRSKVRAAGGGTGLALVALLSCILTCARTLTGCLGEDASLRDRGMHGERLVNVALLIAYFGHFPCLHNTPDLRSRRHSCTHSHT
jgi:hypothetical protein